jgi:hypothetical protein
VEASENAAVSQQVNPKYCQPRFEGRNYAEPFPSLVMIDLQRERASVQSYSGKPTLYLNVMLPKKSLIACWSKHVIFDGTKYVFIIRITTDKSCYSAHVI